MTWGQTMWQRVLDIFLSPNRLNLRLVLGMLLWLALLIFEKPDLGSRKWGEFLLILAALLVVPIGLTWLIPLNDGRIQTLWRCLHGLHLPAGILLAVSFSLQPGMAAVLSAVPWIGVLFGLFLLGLSRLINSHSWDASELSFDIGGMFTIIGGAWLVCDRLAYRPFGFDSEIVLLTAIHFHYAALALPLAAGLLAQAEPRWWTKLSALGTIVTVPLVAAGITVTHFTNFMNLESLAASLLSLFGIVVAVGQLFLIRRTTLLIITRLGLAVGALALMGAMVLSLLYGLRPYLQLRELDIPFMRKWHGSLGALAFAAVTLMSWYHKARRLQELANGLPAGTEPNNLLR